MTTITFTLRNTAHHLAFASLALVSIFTVAACGSSGSSNGSNLVDDTTTTDNTLDNTTTQPTSRAGRTTQHSIPSDIDAAAIAFTVHEPDEFTEGETYPLILHSHGYSGAREQTRGGNALIAMLLAEGYGVLSLDERGNGESGGEVRILDPEFEGQDWLQTLDWAEENLAWLAYDPTGLDTGLGKGNPIMGAIGGSYGGGYQNMVYAIDNKHRLDAIAPDITWNDLRYSLFSGGVFKSLWGTLLAGLGSRPPNDQHQDVEEGLAQGNGTNTLDQDKLDLLYQNSLESHCRGENDFTTDNGLRPIDALYSQSHLDTLFNFNDAYHNVDCLRNLGGDVRLMVKFGGHGLDAGDNDHNQQCGPILRNEATVAWYNEKLKGETGAADYIPSICYNLGREGTDGITVNDIQIGGTEQSFSQDMITVGETASSNAVIVDPPLFTAGQDGEILAGIPLLTINVSGTFVDTPDEDTPADPILFVGLGVRSGSINPTYPLMNQITPIRGLGDFNDVELIGVLQRLQEGDEVVLMVLPNSNNGAADVTEANAELIISGNPPSGGDIRAVGQYPTNASAVQYLLDISGTIELPLIGTNHPAATLP